MRFHSITLIALLCHIFLFNSPGLCSGNSSTIDIVWPPPHTPANHYRIEIRKISIEFSAETVYYHYSEQPGCSLEIEEGYRFVVRVQSVNSFGVLSDYSESTEFFYTTEEKSDNTPLVFRLEQNNPNPFNPSTTIRFTLPIDSPVRITIRNLAGIGVAELAEGYFEKGEHSIEWNASSMPSGIYFYTLETNTFLSTKKMLLLK